MPVGTVITNCAQKYGVIVTADGNMVGVSILRIINFSNYFMNGKDENGDDDGVDVAQPHERRVQLIEVLLVDVVHETLSSGPRRAAARRGVPWMK